MQLRVVSARVAMHKNGCMQGLIFAKVDIRKDVMPHVDSCSARGDPEKLAHGRHIQLQVAFAPYRRAMLLVIPGIDVWGTLASASAIVLLCLRMQAVCCRLCHSAVICHYR